MFVPFKTALAVLFAASVPLQLGANTQPPSSVLLGAKEVRTAEAQAKTVEDQPGTGRKLSRIQGRLPARRYRTPIGMPGHGRASIARTCRKRRNLPPFHRATKITLQRASTA